MAKIIKTNPLQINTLDTPFRVGERINTLSEITSIPNPYEGEIVYVKDENKHYVVTELTGKIVSGHEFPNSVVSKWEIFQGIGNIKTIEFGQVTGELDENSDINIGTQSKDLKWKIQYSDLINVTMVTGNSYDTPEEANTELYELWKDSVQSEKPEGCIRRFRDHNNNWHDYQYTTLGWEEIGNYFEIDYSDIPLYPYYIKDGTVNNSDNFQTDPTKPPVYGSGISDYILVNKQDELYYNGYLTSISGIITYDKDYNYTKNFSVIQGDSSTPSKTIRQIKVKDLDENTKYIRVCFRTNLNLTTPLVNVFKIYSTEGLQNNFSKYRQISDDLREIENTFSTVNAAFWDPNSLDPQAAVIVGDMDIINKKGVYLINIPSTGEVQIIGELQKNNWFKFTDGNYAPVVVTTDPTQPWETTDKGYDIVIGWKDPIWMIGGETGESGRKIYGFFNKPTFYEGIQARLVEPTGISAGAYSVEKASDNSPARSIFFSQSMPVGSWPANGYAVFNQEGTLLNRYTGFSNGRCWRYAFDRITGDQYCKNKNPGYTGFTPASPVMMYHWMSHIYSAIIKYGTKNLQEKWGTGVNGAYDSSAANWETKTGFRYKINGQENYIYSGNAPKNNFYRYPSATSSTLTKIPSLTSLFNSLNADISLCLEQQIVLSWIVENNIQPDTKFQYLGFTYWYKNIEGQPTLLEGPDMNAKLFKEYSLSNFKVLDETGAEILLDSVEACIQYPILDGELLGIAPCRQYVTGFEAVVTMNKIPNVEKVDIYDNPATLYLCTKQEDIVELNSYSAIGANESYGFEGVYEKIDDILLDISANSISETYPYTLFPKTIGGNYTNGECLYSRAYCSSGTNGWGESNTDVGKKKLVYPTIKDTSLDASSKSTFRSLFHSSSEESISLCGYFQVKLK